MNGAGIGAVDTDLGAALYSRAPANTTDIVTVADDGGSTNLLGSDVGARNGASGTSGASCPDGSLQMIGTETDPKSGVAASRSLTVNLNVSVASSHQHVPSTPVGRSRRNSWHQNGDAAAVKHGDGATTGADAKVAAVGTQKSHVSSQSQGERGVTLQKRSESTNGRDDGVGGTSTSRSLVWKKCQRWALRSAWWAVLLVGGGCAILAWQLSYACETERYNIIYRDRCSHQMSMLSERTDQVLQSITALASLFSSVGRDAVSRSAFGEFVGNVIGTNNSVALGGSPSGLMSVQWWRRVAGGNDTSARLAYETATSDVWNRTVIISQSSTTPNDTRQISRPVETEYYPLTYCVTTLADGTQLFPEETVGFDALSMGVTVATLDQSIRSGEIVATAPLSTVDGDTPLFVILYAAVYATIADPITGRGGIPQTEDERIAACLGVVSATIGFHYTTLCSYFDIHCHTSYCYRGTHTHTHTHTHPSPDILRSASHIPTTHHFPRTRAFHIFVTSRRVSPARSRF